MTLKADPFYLQVCLRQHLKVVIIEIITILDELLELSEELRQKKEELIFSFLSLFPPFLIHNPLDIAERFISLGESE